MLAGEQVTIFGNGEQTRDFVNVADVVQANIKAATTNGVSGAFNLASGTQVTINDLYSSICEHAEIDRPPIFGPERPGDVLHSLADVSFAHDSFSYEPNVDIESGLQRYVAWAKEEFERVRQINSNKL